MQIRRRTLALLILGSLLLGVATGVFAKPAEIETRISYEDRIVYQDREVLKTVEVASKATDDHREKIINFKRTVSPSGAVTEEGQVVYRDHTQQTESRHLTLDVDRTVNMDRDTKKSETVVIRNQSKWTVFAGVAAVPSLSPVGVSPAYLVGFTYRWLGPVSIGAYGTFQQSNLQPALGAVVSVSF